MKPILLSIALLLGATLAKAGPYLNVSATQLADFYYSVGQGPSLVQTVQLQSALLGSMNGNGTISAAASSHFEVSLDNTNYSQSVAIPFSDDTLGTTNLFVRLKAGQMSGYWKTDALTISSSTAAFGTKTVTLIGSVATAPLVASIGTVNATTVNLSWNATGVAADDWQYVLDQKAAAPTGAGTVTTAKSFTPTGLNPKTTYYFHVRSRLDVWYSNWTTVSFTTSAPANVPGTAGQASLVIVPNPNSGSFRLEGVLNSVTSQAVQIQVVNVAGQTVWSGRTIADAGKIRVGISTPLPSGIYSVRVSNGLTTQELSLRVAN